MGGSGEGKSGARAIRWTVALVMSAVGSQILHCSGTPDASAILQPAYDEHRAQLSCGAAARNGKSAPLPKPMWRYQYAAQTPIAKTLGNR